MVALARLLWDRAKTSYNRFVLDSPRFSFTLFVGFWSGVVALCVDLDHFTMLWGHQHGRVAHKTLFILACVVAIYYGACLGRLLIGLVLRKIRKGPVK